jgi:hypothetical protein
MKKLLVMVACGAMLVLGIAATFAPAEARRGGGVHRHGGGNMHMRAGNVNRHVNRNINRNISRNVNRHVDRNRYVYRNGRRGYWRNGVWFAVPAVAGATYVASCSYEYSRWQATGSSYWRDRYYACAN